MEKEMNSCQGFCKKAVNTNFGLSADIIPGSKVKIKQLKNGAVACPIGCKTNPKDEEATKNAIREHGRDSICLRNKWCH